MGAEELYNEVSGAFGAAGWQWIDCRAFQSLVPGFPHGLALYYPMTLAVVVVQPYTQPTQEEFAFAAAYQGVWAVCHGQEDVLRLVRLYSQVLIARS